MTNVSLANAEQEQHLLRRLWRYQAERFPLLTNGIVITVFAVSAVGMSTLLTGRAGELNLAGLLTATAITMIAFLHLRIADEFKDRKVDQRWRPHRPVPRGLISLKELALLGVLGALGQFFFSLLLDPRLVGVLFLVWGYFALMSFEFFVASWLRRSPFVYLLSHMPIVPLIGFYAVACDWLIVDADIDLIGLALFLVMCGAGSVVFEIGRKIRAPADEAPGVETYTCLWGAPRAVAIWLAANAIAVACCLALAVHLAFTLPALTIVTGLGMVVAVVAIRFLQFPTRQSAAIVEVVSGVANVLVLITAGILPWLVPQ